MAQIYKVIKPVEIGNKTYRRGEEVALSAREAEKLMNEGYLANTRNGFPDTAVADAKKKGEKPEQSREPDMSDKSDKALVDEEAARKKEKHDELNAKEEEKAEAKDGREAEKDEKLEAKRIEAVKVAEELGREDISKLEAMSEDELDKEIKEMTGNKVADKKEEKKANKK